MKRPNWTYDDRLLILLFMVIALWVLVILSLLGIKV